MKQSKGEAALAWQLKALGIPFETEFVFAPPRKWRADFALADKVLVEVDGGIWSGGRHTRGRGFLGDLEKKRAATKLGYRLIAFSTQEVTDGIALKFIEEILAMKSGDAVLQDMSRVVAVRAMAATDHDNWPDIQTVIIDLAPTLERGHNFLEASAALANKQPRGAKAGKAIGEIDQFRQKAMDAEMAGVNDTLVAASKVVAVMVEGSHDSSEFFQLVMLLVTEKK